MRLFMLLKSLKEIIPEETALICSCIANGRFIDVLDEELFDTYKNCKVISVGGSFYNRYNEEIWIRPTKRLQSILCKNCSWTNCWENPNHPENSRKSVPNNRITTCNH